MVPSPLTIFLSLVILTATGVIVGGILFVALTSGDLGPDDACENPLTGEERHVVRDATAVAAFQQQWDSIAAQVLAGQPEVVLTFDESQVTARAAAYLDARDAPVDDIVICFHDGYAEARGNAEAPVLGDLPLIGSGFDTETRIRGTVDLTGPSPRLIVTDLDAGSLPGAIEDEVRDEIVRAINDRLTDLAIQYDYALTFTEGFATITARVPGGVTAPAATQ